MLLLRSSVALNERRRLEEVHDVVSCLMVFSILHTWMISVVILVKGLRVLVHNLIL